MMMLMPVVDRYGPAIEWDLRALWQVDIHEYFRGERPWPQLARFLDQCPPTSRFVIAKKNDPDVALDIARRIREAHKEGKSPWRPPMIGWDTHAELLASVLDRLGELLAVTNDLPPRMAGKKGKTKPPKPTKRPRTAIEDAEKYLSEEHVAEIVEDVEASKVSEAEYLAMVAEMEAQAEAAKTVQSEGQPSPSI